MKHFQNFIAIDWSRAKTIRTESIAVAKATIAKDAPNLLSPDDNSLWSRQSVEKFIKESSLCMALLSSLFMLQAVD